MKKTIITFAVALATIITANAQEFKVGVKAGFLMSSVSNPQASVSIGGITGTAEITTGYRPGFHFGTFIEYGFNEQLWVEAGLDYSFQGAYINSLTGNVNNISLGEVDIKDGKLKIEQLNIPLWIKYDFNGFRPKIGLNLGFLSKAKVSAEDNSTYKIIKVDDESITLDKKFDLGLGLGAEYNFNSGFFIDATFNLGLTDLSTKLYSEGGNLPPLTFKSRAFQVGVGYKF
ncbi:hypothetical protein RCZ04_07670 [Capnocytophaga sp. HP1101]